jgi:hypothetical protein
VFDPEKGHSNNVAYSKRLEQQLVQVVRSALSGMKPAQLAVGSGASPVGANRRQVVQDEQTGNPKVILGRNPSAAVDHEVQVQKLTYIEGNELAAILFAYDTHSTSLGPRNYVISGDVHGLAEQFLENYLGAGVVAAGFAGTSGNIDPWYRILPDFKTTNGWIPETILLGTLLGEEVAHVLEESAKPASIGSIQSSFKTVQLPAKPKSSDGTNGGASKVPFNITVGCIGEIAFVGLGGEVFNEIGQMIKANSPFKFTFIVTHCNGAAGYLPTEPSYAAGGYEVQSSPFAAGAAEKVAETALEMLSGLKH